MQFILLCYHEYLSECIRKMKLSLGIPNGDYDHDLKLNLDLDLDLEKKLKGWLDNTSMYLQLQWFDTIEGVEISTTLRSKRWTTEITKRDNMYLEKLGFKSAF